MPQPSAGVTPSGQARAQTPGGAGGAGHARQPTACAGNTPALIFTIDGGGIDDIVAGLAEQGVVIVTPVSEARGGWSADFLDPDGFGPGLWQSEEFPRSLK